MPANPPSLKHGGRSRLPASLILLLIAVAAVSAGCGSEGVHPLRRELDARAARARDRLETARAEAEAVLARGTRDRSADLALARDQARRALEEGTAVLEDAARDGGEAAAGWARVIQERMMRLQQSIRPPDDADGRSADS